MSQLPNKLPFLDGIKIAVVGLTDDVRASVWQTRLNKLSVTPYTFPTLTCDGIMQAIAAHQKFDVVIIDTPPSHVTECAKDINNLRANGTKLFLLDSPEAAQDDKLKKLGVVRCPTDDGADAAIRALILKIIEAGILKDDNLQQAKDFVANARSGGAASRQR